MKEKYIYMCSNPWCQAENESGFKLIFPEELVDDQNIAIMFCPKCNSKLELTSLDQSFQDCD